MRRFDNRVAVVSGAAQGMGKAAAQAFDWVVRASGIEPLTPTMSR
jgi:NAD(P)-dependent dehydrogenase (short-subunit alcohol dehydrogenase family)